MYPPLFKGTVANGATLYVGVPLDDASIVSLQLAWKDGVSSGAFTFETTNFPASEAPVDTAGSAWLWKTEPAVSITGPSASSGNSTVVHIGNLGATRGRIKFVAAANSNLEIRAQRKR